MASPSKSRTGLSEAATTAAYIKAYTKYELDWGYILGERFRGIISADAARIRTSSSHIMANLLRAISAVLGGNTSIKVKDGHMIGTNIYQLLVADSGSGKTQSFNSFFLNPIRNVEKTENVPLIIDECTPAGFVTFLSKNNGTGVFASDEFCQVLKAKLTSRHEENMAFRSQLNKFYNGQGVSKVYASRGSLELDEVYLTILGATQPYPFAGFHLEASSMHDGLLDRFMVLCAPPYADEEPQMQSSQAVEIAANASRDSMLPVINEYVLALYKWHHTENGQPKAVMYEFEKDAKEFLQGILELSYNAKKQAYREAGQKLLDGDKMDLSDIPERNTDAKDFEYVIKYAAILHILCNTMNAALERELASLDIPLVITKDIVERAYNMMTKFRHQQQTFQRSYGEVFTPTSDVTQTNYVLGTLAGDPESIQKMILLFPGPLVTPTMVTRMNRNVRSKPIKMPDLMRQLSKNRGQPNHGGHYKTYRNKTVFYKAYPRFIDRSLLEKLKISLEDYTKSYDKNIATQAPANGIASNWEPFYADLLAHKPEDMDTE